jgi:hypothetical protein
MTTTSPFSTLPPEIICRVFEFSENFSVVAALAQTARTFYYTWRQYATSICRAVAPRAIECLADAERLLDVQEAVEAINHSQSDCEQKSVIRAKRLLANARSASAAADDWTNLCLTYSQFSEWDRGKNPQRIRPSERVRFKHAFYCVWAIGVMVQAPHLQDEASAFLDGCSERELFRLAEFSDYSKNYNDNNFGSTGLDFKHEVWKAGREAVKRRHIACSRKRRGLAAPDGQFLPFGFFAFFDHTQRWVEFLPDE